MVAYRATIEARRSADAAEEAANAARDTLRLNQRPWLGYSGDHFEARANNEFRWVERALEVGEAFRVSRHIQNIGNTPALNVLLMNTQPRLIHVDEIPPEPEEGEWSEVSRTLVIFPNDTGISHNISGRPMSVQDYSMYSSGERRIFLWSKIYYCDITGHRHWTQEGIARFHGASESLILASSASPDPGEPNHEDCQD